MPAGPIFGCAQEVSDPQEGHSVIRKILQNAGFAGFFEGYNPFTISDGELISKTADLPVVRIRPTGLGDGACEPGGWAWVFSIILVVGIIWILAR
jgi:hypothetical protein